MDDEEEEEVDLPCGYVNTNVKVDFVKNNVRMIWVHLCATSLFCRTVIIQSLLPAGAFPTFLYGSKRWFCSALLLGWSQAKYIC